MQRSDLLAPQRLGASAKLVSRLALGSVKFGRNQGVKYPQAFQLPSDAQLLSLLDTARSAGINLIDSAPAYGSAEQRLGSLVGSDPYWIISTKVGESFSSGQSHFDFSHAGILRSLERSRRRLQREQLDLVLLHCSDDDYAELTQTPALETLELAKARGWVSQTGASVKSQPALSYAISNCQAIMCAYAQSMSAEQRSLIEPELARAGKLQRVVLLKKVLDSGHSLDHSQALRFAASVAAVSSIVIGTINPEHLLANVAALQSSKEVTQ